MTNSCEISNQQSSWCVWKCGITLNSLLFSWGKCWNTGISGCRISWKNYHSDSANVVLTMICVVLEAINKHSVSIITFQQSNMAGKFTTYYGWCSQAETSMALQGISQPAMWLNTVAAMGGGSKESKSDCQIFQLERCWNQSASHWDANRVSGIFTYIFT